MMPSIGKEGTKEEDTAVKGERGELGPQGPKGEKGNLGDKGDKGDKGDPGLVGLGLTPEQEGLLGKIPQLLKGIATVPWWVLLVVWLATIGIAMMAAVVL